MPDSDAKFSGFIERKCSFDNKPCLTPCVLDCERWPSRIHGKAANSVNASQVGGEHYKFLSPQPWDVIAQWHLGFFEGCALKYLARWRLKNGVEDLRKARHYLDKLIELNSPRNDKD